MNNRSFTTTEGRVIFHKVNNSNIHYYVTEYNSKPFDENIKMILRDYVCFNISPLMSLTNSGFKISEYTSKKIKETNNYNNMFPKTYFLRNQLYHVKIVELQQEKIVKVQNIAGSSVYILYGR